MPQKVDLTPEQEAMVKDLLARAEKKTQKHMNELADRFHKRFRSITIIHSDCQKNRAEHPNLWPIMETMGGASMPKEALYTRSHKAMAKLRSEIRGRKWLTLQKTIFAAEKAINAYDVAVTDYVNRVVKGSNRSVSALKFTKTAGMVALGVLCVTFAAPAATGALAKAGLISELAQGAVSTAVIHGTLGAFLATQVKGLASATGKIAVGDAKKISPSKHLIDTAYQTVMGMVGGGSASKLNPKLASFFGKNPGALGTQVRTRLTFGTVKAALENIGGTITKRAPAVAKATAKNMTGRETPAEFEALLIMQLAQDPVVRKDLAEQLMKQREMGPFPKK